MKLKQFVIFMLCLLISLANVLAETSVVENKSMQLSRDGIQNKIEILKAKKGIDEASKARELNWYQLADENIASKEWFEFLIANYQKILADAPKNLKKKTKFEKKADQKNDLPIDGLTDEELESQVVTLKQELRSVIDAISKLEAELNQYTQRTQLIREETLIARQALEKAQSELNIPLNATENKYEFAAHQIYLSALINSLSAELEKLALEGEANPVQIQLNKKAQDELREKKAGLILLIDARVSLLEQQSMNKSKKLQQELIQAEKETEHKYPAVQTMLSNNIQWSLELQQIISATNKLNHDIEIIDTYTQVVADNHKHAEKKIKLAGLSPALGRVLREQRRGLMLDRLKYDDKVDIQDQANVISLAQYKVEGRQSQLSDVQAETDRQVGLIAKSHAADLSSYEIEELTQEIELLLAKEKQLLDELSDAYAQEIRILGNYEFAKQQMLMEVKEYESYLDERLLWVPSSLPVSLSYPISIYSSAQWLLLPAHWLQVGEQMLGAIAANPFKSSIAAIFFIGLLYVKPYIKRQKLQITEKVKKHYTDKIVYTFVTLFLNAVFIIPIPFVLLISGYLLTTLSFTHEFSRAVGAGLMYAAVVLWLLQFFLKFFESQGVAELHFKWSEQTVVFLRKQISWMRFVVVPGMFIIYMTSALSAAEHSDSLGRFALFCFMAILMIFYLRVLQPNTGVFKDYYSRHPTLWWVKLRYVWFICVLSIPLTIMGFALIGYYISALELQNKIIVSMRVIFVAIIVHSLIIRWLTLTKRKMALKNARQKRKAQEINAKQAEAISNEELLAQEEMLDIPKINEQTIKIVNVLIVVSLFISFWLIWKNILPAFSFLDNIILWQHREVIDSQEIIQTTTLTDLLLAGLYIFIIINAVINFPGVMEILVFRNIKVEAGTRYAIIQLAKYVLISFGFIAVANVLGGSWSQVQWLVAALSVGLGFGLQEIFANMVSGVILLFERPIRVGDTVTIDGIDGKVTRIQMRATTIVDWNAKELIVPNKSFITNKLVNWTLTDPVTRVVIPLGIAYGSDVEKAHKLILDIVKSTPLVLKDPEPSVLFLEFGESSLNFSIRVHVSELGHRLTVTHDLHIRLNAALNKEGIEIPFPQRDLHLRSMNVDLPVKAN